MTTTYREESDSLGVVCIPADRLWGAQTQRALENFPIGTERMPLPLIHALTGLPVTRTPDHFAANASHDVFVDLSGALGGAAAAFSKIAGDIRFRAVPVRTARRGSAWKRLSTRWVPFLGRGMFPSFG